MTSSVAGDWIGVRVDPRTVSRTRARLGRVWMFVLPLVSPSEALSTGSWKPCNVVVFRKSDGRTLVAFPYLWDTDVSRHVDDLQQRLAQLDVDAFSRELDLDPAVVRTW